MVEYLMGCAGALWLGILTSVSPCPLATNIAAVSFIGRRAGDRKEVFLAGSLYALGRVAAYVLIGTLLVWSLLSVPLVSQFLSRYLNRLLGPILILVGMVLLDLVRIPVRGWAVGKKIQDRAAAMGRLGALLLGLLFALSFCPLSGALFFGSLVPLAVKLESGLVLPSLFGIGTALPVVAFAVVLATGLSTAGRAYAAVGAVERWARWITGGIFLAVGIYFTLVYTFRLLS